MTMDDFRDLVTFIFRPDTINGLRKLFLASAQIDPDDIDDTKYITSKRFSEVRGRPAPYTLLVAVSKLTTSSWLPICLGSSKKTISRSKTKPTLYPFSPL